MSVLEVKEFPGVEEFISNIEDYKKEFLDIGVIAFRNANLSEQDQFKLGASFSKTLGLWPNNVNVYSPHIYVEPHKELAAIGVDENQVMLTWHTDHPWYKNPMSLGVWNMHTLNVKNELCGRTYFYNLRKMYERFSDRHKKLSLDAFVSSQVSNHLYAQAHPYTKKPVPRSLSLHRDSDPLIFLNGEKPSFIDKLDFYEMLDDVKYKIENDEENRIEHRWQKGDLLLVDMFVMAHAVTGGFNPGDRIFTGMWFYIKDFDELSNPWLGVRDGHAVWPEVQDFEAEHNLKEEYISWKEALGAEDEFNDE